MSDKDKKKKADSALRDDELEKALNQVKHNTIKIDFNHLESVLRYMNTAHRQLIKRVGGIERKLEQDDRFDIMGEQIRQLENNSAETRVSISNIQAKMIDIEK